MSHLLDEVPQDSALKELIGRHGTDLRKSAPNANLPGNSQKCSFFDKAWMPAKRTQKGHA
jgi:hypothetical protein